MKKILGLDIGTTSIGWAVVKTGSEDKSQNEIVKCGVRVVPLTVDENKNFTEGKAITTNADRSKKKGARRSLQRRKLRRESLKKNLRTMGMLELETTIPEVGKNSTFEVLKLRAKSPQEQIALGDLSRVLLNLCKKRGYKSNRKANNPDELGTVLDELGLAKELVAKGITPGQYVLSIFKQGKISAKRVPPFYVSDLRNELKLIFDKQQSFYPEVLTAEFWENIEGKNRAYVNGAFWREQIEQAEMPKGREEKLLQEYQWRADALSKQLSLEEVAFTVVNLSGKIGGSSNYLGDISDRSKTLYFENKTVGQWKLEKILQKNQNTRNQVFYRQDYIDEFNAIWTCQAKFYPEVLTEENRKKVFNSIFYQRPLKSKKYLISTCQLEQFRKDGTKKAHAPKACAKSSPLFQEVKVLQSINDLEITDLDSNTKRKLTADERALLFSELNYSKEISARDILKLLKLTNSDHELNFKSLNGNTTNTKLYGAYQAIADAEGYDISDGWSKKAMQHNVDSIHEIFTHLGIDTSILSFDASLENEAFEKQSSYQLWHLLYATDDANEIKIEDQAIYGNNNVALKKALCTRYNFTVQQANILCGVMFADDYGSLSAKALRNIYPHLMAGLNYAEACEAAGYNHSNSMTKEDNENRTLQTELEQIKKNSLRNPVVEKILSQMINVVNQLNQAYGPFDQINVELARELKASQKERDLMTQSINEATKRNNDIREKLRKAPFNLLNPTKRDIDFYRMYEELSANGYKTLYSNQKIEAEALFSGVYDIEHIIPQSVLFDDSFSNKTIELRAVNIKKGNATAMDFVEAEYGVAELEQYELRVNALFKKNAISKAKRDKLLKKAGELSDGFIDRDLRNTQYISKKALEILFDITPSVLATTGIITDYLRSEWGLIDTLKEINLPKYKKLGRTKYSERKNGQQVEQIVDWTKRNDHRHHAMDALTTAFTTRAHIKYLNTANAKSAFAVKKVDLFDAPLNNMRAESRKALEEILISFKNKNKVTTRNTNTPRVRGVKGKSTVQLTPRNQLHNETVYGQRKKQEAVEVKVDGKFTIEQAQNVCKPSYREALLARLVENGNDSRNAFAGKNTLSKKPVLLSDGTELPEKVLVNTMSIIYTVRKPITADLKIEKVLDVAIQRILKKRVEEFGGNAKEAFANLEENPIWLNEEKGIAIKVVTIEARTKNAEPLHEKRNQFGELITDAEGKNIPTSYVDTGGNHHVAIYEDEKGKWQE
ncbi:MAG: type II CRISPR RNA-guided endonuclease Cas9, partial [Mangrovibacterium sp.]